MSATNLATEPQARAVAQAAGLSAEMILAPLHQGLSADLWTIREPGADAPLAIIKLPRTRGRSRTVAEAAALGWAHRHGLRQIPDVLHQSDDPPGLVLRWLHPRARPLEEIPAPPPELGAALGRWLAALHRVEVTAASGVKRCDDPLSWPERLSKSLDTSLARAHKLQRRGALADQDLALVQRAHRWWHGRCAVLELPERPARLVHRDLRPANIVCDEAGQFRGVVDLERAAAGDPAWDFVKLRWWVLDRFPSLEAPLLAAYTGPPPAPARLQLYAVHEALGLLAGFGGGHPRYGRGAREVLRAALAGEEETPRWPSPES